MTVPQAESRSLNFAHCLLNAELFSLTTYHYPLFLLPGLAADLLLGRRRSLRADAVASIARMKPGLQVFGEESIPAGASYVLTVNHYTRPGLPAWWMVLASSACVPAEIHWVITAAWTYPDALRARLITPVSRRLFRRLAQVYGFTNMPPMPPDPREIEQRVRAVRQVLQFARQAPRPIIGMAPEGRDAPSGRPGLLVEPPPGVGRFIDQLARCGLAFLPAALWDPGAGLCVRFGAAYTLDLPAGLPAAERDRLASRQVMSSLAALLPAELRGPFGA